MKGDVFDILGKSSGTTPNYTLDEIKRAEELKKKKGGTLLDNLRQVSGHDLPTKSDFEDFYKNLEKDYGMTPGEAERIKQDQAYAESCMQAADAGRRAADGSRQASDAGRQTADADKQADRQGRAPEAYAQAGGDSGRKASGCKDRFEGLDEELGRKVFGQEEFLRRLVIAFKRPTVMPPEAGMPGNSIFITGPERSGRHLALRETASELKKRGILKNGSISTIDLSLYTDAGDEQLFLQDLYSALSSGSDIVLFENYEKCQPSLLTYIGSLIRTGSCRLSARYVMQNGQLINAANALASNAVGTLTAAGRYLVLISSGKEEKLGDCFGSPVVSAIGDICRSRKLDAQALRRVAVRESACLRSEAMEKLGFELEYGENVIEASLEGSEGPEGPAAVTGFYDRLLKSLVELRLEKKLPESLKLTVKEEEGCFKAVSETDSYELTGMKQEGYTGSLTAVRRELDSIVGLTEVKNYILGLEEFYSIQKRRRDEGLKNGEISRHMMFTGNPGTGKTTIARILSRYLKALGILSGGQLVEVSRADLVGRYVGHTAPLTNKVIASAIGGVLFIDEAYSLCRGRDDSFGLEAIDALVKGIEDNRDNLIVVLAGYSKEMEEFLESNSGLKSRFPNRIEFPDYTGEELLKITELQARSRGYEIDEEAKPALLAYYTKVQAQDAGSAGNGRMARNKLEEAILNQSRRLVAEPEGDLSLLLKGDFDLPAAEV